jgi:hypothetical protein
MAHEKIAAKPAAARAPALLPFGTPIPASTNLPADIERRAAAELAQRHYCVWIANPGSHRCPRWERTGEDCFCKIVRAQESEWDWWPWRILPPLRSATSAEPSTGRKAKKKSGSDGNG